MHVKLLIIICCIKWSSEVINLVASTRKKVYFYLLVSPSVRTFLCYFGHVGMCVNES